jgi:hypothetical protein
MDEQRKESRKKLMAFTPVYDSGQNILLGYVEDLTLSGILVVGETAVEANQEHVLRIEFPITLPNVATAHITIPARVVWCRPDKSPQYFNIGCEFIDVTPEQVKIFRAILKKYQFRHDFSGALTFWDSQPDTPDSAP